MYMYLMIEGSSSQNNADVIEPLRLVTPLLLIVVHHVDSPRKPDQPVWEFLPSLNDEKERESCLKRQGGRVNAAKIP